MIAHFKFNRFNSLKRFFISKNLISVFKLYEFSVALDKEKKMK